MRRLGLVGGVTWHSTSKYYAGINARVAEGLGPFRSADLVLRSLDYGAVRAARASADHREFARLVVRAAREVRAGGAEAIGLCSNSLHGVAHRVEAEVGLEVLHIADSLADGAHARGQKTLAFFGTGFTMRQRFVLDRLRARGLEVVLPSDLDAVDAIIMDELARGVVRDESRQALLDSLADCVERGADAMVLGCTELGMLFEDGSSAPVPILDTLALHIDQLARWAMGDEQT